MTGNSWESEPHSIHVFADEAAALRLEQDALRAGARVIRVDLSGIRDREALAAHLIQTFEVPHPSKGMDAALDDISDLQWLGVASGYLVIFAGQDVADAAITGLAGILPAIVDRWRTQEKPFVVAVAGQWDRTAILAALDTANASLDEHARLPWSIPGTSSVPISTGG